MSEITLTRMRLAGGVWEGLLATAQGVKPRLTLRHRDDHIGEPEVTAATPSGQWLVRFRLPLDRITDGVQTFVVENAETGDALAHETIIAGEALNEDLHAEVDLLRAELDMLKRAFRRHCAET
ncbi:MAG: hypothetical protein HKP37_02945 [Boseongicola sp.]|nr:hypothetical protein [Boseongicola sp.]